MADPFAFPFPPVVRIEPSAGCNLACHHCLTGTVKMARGIMKDEVFRRILDGLEAHRDNIRAVVMYHGGEPLLHRRFTGMVREVKAIGIPFVKTVSNGTLMTAAVIADLVDCGLDGIEFSLDGDSPEVSNLVRRDSDAATIVANVKRLLDHKRATGAAKPDVTICQVVFVDPERYVAERQHARFSDPEVYLDGQSQEPAAWVAEAFSGPYEGTVDYKVNRAYRWPSIELDEEVFGTFRDPFDDQDKDSCDLLVNTVTVRADGGVVPCCFDVNSRMVMGNILDDDLDTIWNNGSFRKLRGSIARKDYAPLCSECYFVRPYVFLTLNPEPLERT